MFLSALLFSCNKAEIKELPTFTVHKTTFEEYITQYGTVEPVETTVLSCPLYSDGDVTFIVPDGTFVKAGDLVCTIEDKRLKKNYNEALIQLEMEKAQLSKTRTELDFQYALLEAQVKNNLAQSQISNLDSLQLNFLSPKEKRIKELELQKVAIDKAKLEKKLRSLAIINNSELRRNEFTIQQLEDQIKTAKTQLEALNIKAPKDGVALVVTHYTGQKLKVGDNVWNNMPVLKIPNATKVKIVFKSPEIDYKQIEIADSVVMTFDAMPGNIAWGKISTKSPVGQPYKEKSKVKLFDMEASVDSCISTPGLGLSANLKIYLKRQPNVIAIPQIGCFDYEGIKVVYVKQPNGYEMRQVQVGVSSQKSTVITSGLKVNELISLAKPPTDNIVSKTFFAKKKKTVTPTAKTKK